MIFYGFNSLNDLALPGLAMALGIAFHVYSVSIALKTEPSLAYYPNAFQKCGRIVSIALND